MSESDGPGIGRRVAAVRKARGLNKLALARRAGVHHSYVVKLEQGHFERPSIDYIARIAAVLGVRLVDLTMDSPIATTSGALRSELAPLGYRDDEMELVVDIVNQVARYSVPTRGRLLLMIQMLMTPSPNDDDEDSPLGLSRLDRLICVKAFVVITTAPAIRLTTHVRQRRWGYPPRRTQSPASRRRDRRRGVSSAHRGKRAPLPLVGGAFV